MENENLEQEESILTLTDENGQDMDFEYLDCLPYEGKEYLVLMPADEPSTDGVGVGVDSDIATEPAPAQRGDTATWHCVSIDGEPRNWITRPVLADMDELSIIVEEG